MKFNITKKSLEQAVAYAEKFGESEFKTISMEVADDSCIGESFRVTTLSDVDKTGIDITDVNSF